MRIMALLLAAALSTCAWAAPDASRLPPIVRSGFTRYKADGAQAAITAWMVGSPIALGEQPEREVRALRQFESRFGAYQDFHVVRIVTISPTTQMIYLQLDYLNGPAFGKFLVYQARETTWNITSFSFGGDPEALWGASLLSAPDVL
jgi:hypothetical protein